MDEQDKKILELYLKDIKKKKIIFLSILIFFIISTLFYGFFIKFKSYTRKIENNLSKEIESNTINIIDTDEELKESENLDSIEETSKQEKVNEEAKENIVQENKEEIEMKTNEKVDSKNESNENKEKSTNVKPSNKDFLFTDGYTMENVTQAAQEYLKSFNASGECIPIKDNDGVYLGMRVIFY